MAAHLREKFPETKVSILYDGSLAIPFGTFDRARARQLGIALIPYDGNIRPR